MRNNKGDTALHVGARNGDQSSIRIIIKSYKNHFENKMNKENNEEALWRMRNEHGNTALHEAVMANSVEAAKLLYEKDKDGAHFLNKEGKSPLYLAIHNRNNGVTRLLLQAPFQDRENHQGSSPLVAAILAENSGRRIAAAEETGYGYLSMMESWLIVGTTPASSAQDHKQEQEDTTLSSVSLKELVRVRPELMYLRDQKGRTPLHYSASIGYLEGVRTIVNASPQSMLECVCDTKGYLPIHVACKNGHVNVVQEFIQRTCFDPMESQNQKGQNILHIAAKGGKDTVVNYILREKKVENLLNEKDKNGNTPLHLAAKYLHLKVLLLLTHEKNLNVNLANNEGLTARDIVIQRRNTPPTVRESKLGA
ncbi:protein ACCELERATED CELL DEATH 6-like [Prosopis cineraria]|uniref:protein ACCELERATED CELL DEATH 6-like n=1 Tax=Prosopis cineraria TaxID=364024 RepID=UPI00240F04EB|nr:protein ACCELERATED CELL DEATH 6-like [Prosopis cineraria]